MKYLKQVLSILVVFFVFSCNDSENSTHTIGSNDTAKLSMKLVDEPGDYENVFIEIIDVMVKYENEDDNDENGWESMGIISPGIYDLLELTGGISLQLIDNEEIQTGIIKQIRLILGDENSVVLEGEVEARELNTPSAQQSGLKVMVNEPILSGFNYDFILDFNVDESIVMAGNSGNINLKPVLRAALEVNSGSLTGNVLPSDIAIEIEATNGTINASTLTNDSGDFEISGLPEGIYTVTITPEENSMLNPVIVENVEVIVGETTILESIILE